MTRLKILTRRHAVRLRTRGHSTKCVICGDELEGKLCYHSKSGGRNKKIRLHCPEHFFAEPKKEVR